MESFIRNNLKENDFGVQDTLNSGLNNVKNQLKPSHALEVQEKNYSQLEDKLTMSQMKISQGLYAPFKYNMEMEFSKKVGRLPCLRSSNLMLSVIRGTDETIEIEDFLNNQKEFGEYNRDLHQL